MTTMNINNKSYVGRSISMVNNKLFVDGKEITADHSDAKVITVTIQGDVDKLEVDACDKVTVTGNVSSLKTMSGDVDVQGSVAGSISTMSGDVDCGNVGGSISTMSGDVKHRKS